MRPVPTAAEHLTVGKHLFFTLALAPVLAAAEQHLAVVSDDLEDYEERLGPDHHRRTLEQPQDLTRELLSTPVNLDSVIS